MEETSTALPPQGKDNRRLYSDLSWLWPVISPPQHYVGEAQDFVRVIQKYAKIQVSSLLDLGCGAGHNDHTLKGYFTITGVDTSEAMLAQARALNPEATYRLGDMRCLDMGAMFDAVMVADSIDYMLSEADLLAVFKTAYRHLRPGGVFCTYAEETPERFAQNGTYVDTFQQGDLEISMVENYYDPDPSDTTYEMIFVYLVRKAGVLSIETDHHLGGIFPIETWLSLLAEAGFLVFQETFSEDNSPMFVGIKPEP